MLPARDAHQPDAIAKVVLQGPGDATAQIGRSRLICSAAGLGANQSLAGTQGREAEGGREREAIGRNAKNPPPAGSSDLLDP
jgi:hypothetical protein